MHTVVEHKGLSLITLMIICMVSLFQLLPVHFVHRCTTTRWICGVSAVCLPVWYSAKSHFFTAMTTTTRSAWLFVVRIFMNWMAFDVKVILPLASEDWLKDEEKMWPESDFPQSDSVLRHSSMTGRSSIPYRIYAMYLQRFLSGAERKPRGSSPEKWPFKLR